MKSKFFTSLLIATTISAGFASDVSVSTFTQRHDLIKELAGLSTEKAVELLNDKQQSGEIKSNKENYIVAIRKKGDGKYQRVAHFDKEMVGKEISETELLKIMESAETALKDVSGPVAFSFTVNGKTLYCELLKRDDLLIFNICQSKEDVDNLVGKATPTAEAPKLVETPAPVAPAAPVDSAKPAEVTPPSAPIPASTEAQPAPASSERTHPSEPAAAQQPAPQPAVEQKPVTEAPAPAATTTDSAVEAAKPEEKKPTVETPAGQIANAEKPAAAA